MRVSLTIFKAIPHRPRQVLAAARSADCLLIQETKAHKLSPIFERLKDHFTVLHNPHPTSRHQAGPAILMSLRYAQHFDIKEEIIAAAEEPLEEKQWPE